MQLLLKRKKEDERVGVALPIAMDYFCEDFVLGVLPLDIVGLPEYEKLSEPERDLCTELRFLKCIMRFVNIRRIPPKLS